jgi:hypothetical protein
LQREGRVGAGAVKGCDEISEAQLGHVCNVAIA